MKKILMTALFAFTFSCTPKKATLTINPVSEINIANANCPEDGTCTIEVVKNKKLSVRTDDLNSVYFNLIDDNDYAVIKYTYQKTVDKNLQDASYTEEIIFEVKNNNQNWSLSNQELQNVKLLFGKHCYCKGQAGYFKINTGTITSQTIKDKTEYNIDFKTTEVPQVLKKVNFLIP